MQQLHQFFKINDRFIVNGFIDRLLPGLDPESAGGDPDRDDPTAWGNL